MAEYDSITAYSTGWLIDSLPKPPNVKGAYAQEYGIPMNHYVILGDIKMGSDLLPKLSDALEQGTGYGIEPSSMSLLSGALLYGMAPKVRLQEVYLQYSEIPDSIVLITRSNKKPISLIYYNYSNLLPPERMSLIYTLPNKEEVRPDMILLLEDRLTDIGTDREVLRMASEEPDEYTDIEIFRKSFIIDYLERHKIPYIDIPSSRMIRN